MHFHLDLLGGLAGDMYVAAVLDAFPEHADALIAAIDALQPRFERRGSRLAVESFNDGVLKGSRFVVDEGATAGSEPRPPRQGAGVHRHGDPQVHGHASSSADAGVPPGAASSHGHVRWADIRERLQSTLSAGVLRHAVGIFGVLAEAEAEVHGVAVDAVEFHEVGAWDSIVDIVGAAWLLDVLDAGRWSVGPVPLGSGRVRTAHGWMPVPAPATALLLRGFPTIDDGIAGERVTPTGAAILRHLSGLGRAAPATTGRPGAEPRVLRRTGVGFGTRRLDGISNCVRLLAFDEPTVPAPAPAPAHRELAVVEFEVDDQSAEELAIGLDRLRAHAAIFDVVQAPVFGKKGRMMTSVRVLARPADLDAVLDACFRETTTIGLRHTTVHGQALPRRSDEVTVDGHRVRVKTVERPGGTTAKAESDDALAHETHRARRWIRHEAERRVLQAAAGDRGASGG